MDQHKSNTSTLPTVQTVPMGSVSSMPASMPLIRPNEHRRFLEPVAPYGGGPQNVIMNSSALYITPKTNFSGFQQMVVPDNNLSGMGALFNDTKSQYIQMPIKRKAPMENLPGYPLSPIVAMPNSKIEQLEHRPWLNPSASDMSNAQYQVQSAADVLASKQLAAQNRRTIQFQSGPPKSGPQKSLTSRSHPSQGQLSYKVQNQPNESVRSKLRESIRDVLALFSEKDKSLSKGGASASASANASDQMQEGSLLAKIASSVSHDELSGENPTAANGDCSTQIEKNVKIQLTDIDCDVGGSLQIHECAGQDLNMIDLLPDDESITGDSITKDDLLQGIGLAWLSDFDAWIAEKEGRDPKKQKVGESVGGAWEVKKTICPQNLALQIELELFNLFGGVNKKYKEKGRSLLFNLKDKNNPELREKVMSGEISPARLCSMTAEELASKELSEWRIAKAEEFEQMKILPDSEIDIRRLVKKTHKGEFQVEVEEDDVSVEVSVGSSSFPRRQTEAKESKPQTDQESKPQSGQKPDGGQKKTRNDKTKSEEQNLQCNITIPSNESSDRMQRLIEDELKDAEFLQPIVSLDEFMESIHTEPPFDNLRPDADKIAVSPENDHTGAPSETKAAELSSYIHTNATSETQNNLNSTDPAVDIKPSENQPKEILPPMVSKGERIWVGSLQLNVSSTVSVSLFFGRGERAPMKEWPRTIDIKGRVRMDAFEKFLQDLYKSQSRSIMVVHVVLKESEGEESEALNKVVDSYVADDRVGFAEPLSGLEIYMCPCHPKILDRIGKHLVKDQTEALTLTGDDKGLIGVIVSRKAHVSPKSSSHHKQRFKKHQQEHYISSRRQNHHQDRNINVNSPNLKPKFPVVPLVSSKTSYSATDEDDLPPGFGPPVSQDDDDLPEFNFCGALSRPFPAQKPIGIQTQNRSADQLMQLVQKYGHSAVSAGSGAGGKYWKDGEDDIPEWQPNVPLTPAPQPTPTQVNYQPLNQPMLQHLINQQQQQQQKSSFQHPQAPVLLQTPVSATQHNTPPGWPQTGVWFNPQGPQQGQFYGTQSRGF